MKKSCISLVLMFLLLLCGACSPSVPAEVTPTPQSTDSAATEPPTGTEAPSVTATATPAETQTAQPTEEPSEVPSETPVQTPDTTAEATPDPTAVSTATPGSTAVSTATPGSTASPTAGSTVNPTATPKPTATPTAAPTATPEPTAGVTDTDVSLGLVKAMPYDNGVYFTVPSGYAWFEISLFEEPLNANGDFQTVWNAGHRVSRTDSRWTNNSFTKNAFIDAESSFADGVSFANTPGKTYYFYIVGRRDAAWHYVDKVAYTVPDNPTLTVSVNGNVNTLTYTLVGENAKGVIYRYIGTSAEGDGYDGKIEVTAGGAPIKDTVLPGTTYSYVLAQNFAGEQEFESGKAQNDLGVVPTVTINRTSAKIAFTIQPGTQWWICDPYTTELDRSGRENVGTCIKEIGGADYRFKKIPKWAADGAGIYNPAVIAFGDESITVPLQLKEEWNAENGKLMPGRTYRLKFIAYVNENWGTSYVTITAPLYRDSRVVTVTTEGDPPDIPTEEEVYMQLRAELDAKINSYLNVVPEVKEYPAYNPTGKGNIKAITYDGALLNGQKTKVFAYIGYPSGAKAGDNLPAVVLIHGGGGHAFSDWVKAWNDRGYVAIAMDNTGFFPKKANAGYDSADWQWPLSQCPDFAENGYANVMQTDHFTTTENPIDQQWMYHAVVQAILAHNLLKNDPVVDPAKVGITGISWGGKVTALVMGYDRYAFAIPQYCSAYLNESLTHNGQYHLNYPAFNYLWVAEDRYDNVDYPVLWLQWTKDSSVTPNTNSLAYLRTKETSYLTLIMNWQHSHDWSQEVIYYFADCALQGKDALAKPVNEPVGREFSFTITKPADDTVTARICYMKQPFSSDLDSNVWFFAEAAVNGTTVTGTVPADAVLYYVEFTNKVGTKSYFSASSIVYLS